MMKKLTLNELLIEIAKGIGKEGSILDPELEIRGHHSHIRIEPQADNEPLYEDIAFVLEASRQEAYTQVSQYLARENLKANIVRLTFSREYRLIAPSAREKWEGLMREFSKVITLVHSKAVPKRIHLFLSVPLPLAFGIGCSLGSFIQPYLYHFVNPATGYKLVMSVNHYMQD
jgi:hypothetical protein